MRKYAIYLFYYFHIDEAMWIGLSFDHELWIVKILSSTKAVIVMRSSHYGKTASHSLSNNAMIFYKPPKTIEASQYRNAAHLSNISIELTTY